jgi:neopullulanase
MMDNGINSVFQDNNLIDKSNKTSFDNSSQRGTRQSFGRSIINLLTTLALLLYTVTSQAAYNIEHMEPPFWWVGMKNQQLELLLHGKDIADLNPIINYEGLSVTKTTKVENPNYLFVNLEIAANTKPGTFTIRLNKAGSTQLTLDYSLLEREKDSANRNGFDTSDVIYLITPDRFSNGNPANDNVTTLREKLDRKNPSGRHGGDIQGMTKHLDYVASMGFTAIWCNPLTQNDQPIYSYHGYSITDLYNIDERFGGNNDYKEFVRQARAKGIGIIQDIILNHIGSKHWWNNDIPSPDWINFNKIKSGATRITNHSRTTVQDPYAARQDHKQYVDGWFVDSMPDLNPSTPLLATYLIQNSLWWIEYAGLSGIRADTYSYSDKTFLSHWVNSIMAEYPHFNIVGEEWATNPITVSYWQKGKINTDGYEGTIPSMFDFPLHSSMIEGLNEKEDWGSGFIKMYEMLSNDVIYPNPSNLVFFEGNHDTPRLFSQLNEDYDLYKMAIAYTLTMRGIPQLYYGTEILMRSPMQRDDCAVRSDFPGGWPGDKTNAFSTIGLSTQQKSAQALVKKLLNWRKSATAIHDGKLIHYSPLDGIYTYFRYNNKQKVMIVLNKNPQTTALDTSRFSQVITSETKAIDVISSNRYTLGEHMQVPARSALVLELH